MVAGTATVAVKATSNMMGGGQKKQAEAAQNQQIADLQAQQAAQAQQAPAPAAAPAGGDLVNEEDIAFAAEGLDPDSSAGLLVYENVWATKFRDAIVGSGGQLIDRGYIPADAIEAALEAAQAGD